MVVNKALELYERISKRKAFSDCIEYFEAELLDGKLVVEDPVSGTGGWVMEDLAASGKDTTLIWKSEKQSDLGNHYHDFGGTEKIIVKSGWCKFEFSGKEITLLEDETLTMDASLPHKVVFSDNFVGYITFTPEHPVHIIRMK